MKNVMSILIFGAIFFCMPVLSKSSMGEAPYDKLGKNADGEQLKVSDYRGKVLIVTFWATWCGPCMKEIPISSGIQKKVGTERLQVVAVNYHESKRMFENIAGALKGNPITFSFGYKSKIAKKYGVKAIPHMVIVDKNGKVVSEYIGCSEKSLPSLVGEINSVLNQSGI